MGKLVPETLHNYETRQRGDFDEFLDDFDLSGIDWSRSIRHGRPHDEIIKLVAEIDADLLVLGTVGRTGLARMLVGSTTERVVRQMPCSVITIKTEDVIRLEIREEIADVESRFLKGQESLKTGLVTEAISHFDYCVSKDTMFAPAYEAMAEAHDHLGHPRAAREWHDRASYIHQKNWERKVEAEIRAEQTRDSPSVWT
jgi:hypothetical protein